MGAAFDRYAAILYNHPELRTILDQIAAYLFEVENLAPGQFVRAQYPHTETERIQRTLDVLAPDFLNLYGKSPNDYYDLAPAGLLFSAIGPRASKLVEDILRFFRLRLPQKPAFRSYTWEDLKTFGAVTNDEFRLAQMTIQAMSLQNGGNSAGGHFTCQVPQDIEKLRGLTTVDELFELRDGERMASARQARAALTRTASPGFASTGIAKPNQPSVAVVNHYGDVILGAKVTTNFTDSTVGAVATGDRAQAIGTVNFGTTPPTQEQHRSAIKEAQKALLDDEDHLDPLVFEALTQFLRRAREIRIEERPLVEVQTELARSLGETWLAKGIQRPALPPGLRVVEVLAKNPVMAEIARTLLGA